MHSISWTVAGRQADLSAIRATLAAERRETTARHRAERQRMIDANQSDLDAKKVGAAIRKAVREQDRVTRRTIRATVAAKSTTYDSGRAAKRFEAMLRLNVPKPSARGRDGLSSFHFKVTSRGYSGFGNKGSRRYRAGEAVRHLKYIAREQARETPGAGIVSNISHDRAELAAFFDTVETLEGQDRANANVYVSFVISLPHELAPAGRERLLGEICEVLDKLGLPHAGFLHAPGPEGDPRNFHAHVILSLRPTRIVAPGQYEFSAAKSSDLNDGSFIVEYRRTVADLLNAAMARESHERRFTALSNVERGLEPRTKPSGKSTPGQKNVERRAQRVAEAEARLEQMREQLTVIGQLREKLIRFLAEPLRDFDTEIAAHRADLSRRSQERQALASRKAAEAVAAQQATISPGVDRSVPSANTDADRPAGASSRTVTQTQPSPPVGEPRNGIGGIPSDDARRLEQTAGARSADAGHAGKAPTAAAASPLSTPTVPVQFTSTQIEPLAKPLASTTPASLAVARAQLPITSKGKVAGEASQLSNGLDTSPVEPASLISSTKAPGSASVEQAPPPVPAANLPDPARALRARAHRRQQLRDAAEADDAPMGAASALRDLRSLRDMPKLRDMPSLSSMPVARDVQLRSMGIVRLNPEQVLEAKEEARRPEAGGIAAQAGQTTAIDSAPKIDIRPLAVPDPRADPVRQPQIATLPAVDSIAPVDPVRTAAIKAVVQELRSRIYLPLIRTPSGALELAKSALSDDVLITADRFDADPSIQSTFETARRAMLSDLPDLIRSCRAQPFENAWGRTEFRPSVLDAKLEQAVLAARGEPDLEEIVQAGVELWRQRTVSGRQYEMEPNRRDETKRKLQSKRQGLLSYIEEQVSGTLPEAWTRTERAAAMEPLAHVVSALRREELWLEPKDNGFAIYGRDKRVMNAAKELAQTRIGQTVLDSLAKAVAGLRPEQLMGSPSLVVQNTSVEGQDDLDWRLILAGRAGPRDRGGR